jgi:hypothetical protein
MTKNIRNNQENHSDIIVGILAILMTWAGIDGVLSIFREPTLYGSGLLSGYVSLGLVIFGSMILGVVVHNLSTRTSRGKTNAKKGK